MTVAWVCVAAIAVGDAFTPLGFVHGVLYVAPLAVVAWSGRRSAVAAVAAASVAAIAVGGWVSPGTAAGVSDALVAGNRVLSAAALVAIASVLVALLSSAEAARDARSAVARAYRTLSSSGRLVEIAGEAAHLGGWSVDLRSGRATWSDVVARIHGKPAGFSPAVDEGIAFYHPDDQPLVRAAVQRTASTGEPFDFVLRLHTHDGVERWVRAIGQPVRDVAGAIVAIEGAFQDVTERHLANRRSELLAATLEQISDAFFSLDTMWRFRYLNPRAELVVQRRREDVVGKRIWDEFPEAVGTAFQSQYEDAVATGEPRSFEAHFAPLDLWVEVRAHPTSDGLAVYFQDIGERRVVEERLRTAQRLESVGQLTGGVAHDFNNLLTVIGGNAEMLTDRLADDPAAARLASMVAEAAERGSALTRSLLAFARRQPLEPRRTDVVALLRGVETLLHRTLGEDVELHIAAPASTWTVVIDPHQLENSLLNLALNARDAMQGGGRLTIEVGHAELDEAYGASHDEVAPGAYVVVTVSDTGAGIEAGHLPRVFEPFFTTKPPGSGSGLGLAMVYGFVKQSRGHVTVSSEPGEGTTVRLYLPRHVAPEGGERTLAPRPSDALRGGAETILVVEDDVMVRAVVVEQLRGLGYEVLEARDAAKAVAVLDAHGAVDLLFTDVVMPGGMSGAELASVARASQPGLRVVFTSGYTDDAIVHHHRLDPGVELLSKPYRRTDLAARVRGVLDATREG